MAELPETMPAPTPNNEDQDHELQWMSPTPHMMEQATAYLEAQGSKAGNAIATDLGADTSPLCLAVAKSAMNFTPVNSMSPNPSVDSTVVLEPLWYQARSIIWLLGVRKRVQDDSRILHSDFVLMSVIH